MITPTRAELIELREDEGMTREQIADFYEVSLTTVRRWIKEFQIPRPSKQNDEPKPPRRKRAGTLEPDDGYTVMERAEEILGDRLTERPSIGYFLDGRPASSRIVVEAAGLKFKDEM